jgi:hypothetical protein
MPRASEVIEQGTDTGPPRLRGQLQTAWSVSKPPTGEAVKMRTRAIIGTALRGTAASGTLITDRTVSYLQDPEVNA